MARIVLLDGGMGQELVARSARPPSPLWSAHVLLEEPAVVEQVHRDYIDAGARVMTLCSYAATPQRLQRDASIDLFEPLQAEALRVAGSARGDAPVRIAGCLPPLYASYHPELVPDFDECLETYRRIVAAQHGVDLFLCETLSCQHEAVAATRAASEARLPVWTAFTVQDDDGTRLRSGEPLGDAATAVIGAGAEAVLINCSWPEALTQAMPVLAAQAPVFGGYANGFTSAADLAAGGTTATLGKRTDLDPDAYASHAMHWVEQGARIVGGCCEVGPAHITRLHERLLDAGHEVVAAPV